MGGVFLCAIMFRVPRLRSSKRISQRRALGREQFSTVFCNVHVVFQSNPELAWNVYSGLIAEHHVALQPSRVAADEVGPFVNVHAHAMADAMPEVFVIGTKASIGDDFSGGGIHALAGHSRSRSAEGSALRSMDQIENGFHLVGRLA